MRPAERTHGHGGVRSRRLVALTPRQVNLALELLVVVALASGLASWTLGDGWNGAATFVHGASGLTLALLVPAKVRGSVRTGFRRNRATKWVSAAFGVVVLATVVLGILHSTGLWFGVGTWSALWTHELLGFVTVVLLVWHVVSRPVRPSARDLERRAFLRLGTVAAAAVAVHVVQRPLAAAVGLAGGDRRTTGSHEIASRDPGRMPAVVWFDDDAPSDVDPASWQVEVGGAVVPVAELRARTRPLVAVLDCTGGWWSEQVWDAVPLSELLTDADGRSVRVESATGYSRLFPIDDLADLHLAVGYGGEPLHRRHGAPVRLVVPGRRGFEWVKWVVRVDPGDRPAWLQPPLPLS